LPDLPLKDDTLLSDEGGLLAGIGGGGPFGGGGRFLGGGKEREESEECDGLSPLEVEGKGDLGGDGTGDQLALASSRGLYRLADCDRLLIRAFPVRSFALKNMFIFI